MWRAVITRICSALFSSPVLRCASLVHRMSASGHTIYRTFCLWPTSATHCYATKLPTTNHLSPACTLKSACSNHRRCCYAAERIHGHQLLLLLLLRRPKTRFPWLLRRTSHISAAAAKHASCLPDWCLLCCHGYSDTKFSRSSHGSSWCLSN